MAKIFGKVENPPAPNSFVQTTMKLCFDGCYEDLDCFLTTLPDDTCPVSFEAINLTYIHPDGTAYPWKVLSDGFSFPKCRYGWKLFERSNEKTICMKAMVKTPSGVTKTQAAAECQELGALLIGVESLEEANWMWEELAVPVPSLNAFWLDGVRNESCRPSTNTPEDKLKACDVFDWSNDLTTGSLLFSSGDKSLEMSYFVGGIREDCLVVGIDNSRKKRRLNDVPCTTYENSNGMICGYRLD